jgi:hypothetical protein
LPELKQDNKKNDTDQFSINNLLARKKIKPFAETRFICTFVIYIQR